MQTTDTQQPALTRADLVRLTVERMSRPGYLDAITLRSGVGTGEEGDACLIQRERWELRATALEHGAVALAEDYDPSTDACPPCTSPICRALAIGINDAREDWRTEARDCLLLLPGSAGSEALELQRACRLLDWTAREAMPAGLDALAAALESHDGPLAATLRGHALTIRAMPPIVDAPTAEMFRALDRALALDLDLARALALALDLDLALNLALTLTLNLDLDLARALALNLARALALNLALALDLSPVPLLRELCAMRDDNA